MFKARKNAAETGILVMEVFLFYIILALDVRLGLGRYCSCCCSSSGSFLMVEVDYLAETIGCYKCRCVLCSSLHLISPQYPNSIVIVLDVVVFILFSYHCLNVFLLVLDFDLDPVAVAAPFAVVCCSCCYVFSSSSSSSCSFLFLFLLLILVCCWFVVILCLLFVPVFGFLGVADVVFVVVIILLFLLLHALLGRLWPVVVFVVEVVRRNSFVVGVVLKTMGKP